MTNAKQSLDRFPGSPTWEAKIKAGQAFRDNLDAAEQREAKPFRDRGLPLPMGMEESWAVRRRRNELAYAQQCEQLAATLAKVPVPPTLGNPASDRQQRKIAEEFAVFSDLTEGKVARGELTRRMAERSLAVSRDRRDKELAQVRHPASRAVAARSLLSREERKPVSLVPASAPAPRASHHVTAVVVRRVRSSMSGNPIWELILDDGRKVRTESDTQLGFTLNPVRRGETPIKLHIEFTPKGTVRAAGGSR